MKQGVCKRVQTCANVCGAQPNWSISSPTEMEFGRFSWESIGPVRNSDIGPPSALASGSALRKLAVDGTRCTASERPSSDSSSDKSADKSAELVAHGDEAEVAGL